MLSSTNTVFSCFRENIINNLPRPRRPPVCAVPTSLLCAAFYACHQALRNPPSDVKALDEYGLLDDCEVRLLLIVFGISGFDFSEGLGVQQGGGDIITCTRCIVLKTRVSGITASRPKAFPPRFVAWAARVGNATTHSSRMPHPFLVVSQAGTGTKSDALALGAAPPIPPSPTPLRSTPPHPIPRSTPRSTPPQPHHTIPHHTKPNQTPPLLRSFVRCSRSFTTIAAQLPERPSTPPTACAGEPQMFPLTGAAEGIHAVR